VPQNWEERLECLRGLRCSEVKGWEGNAATQSFYLDPLCSWKRHFFQLFFRPA